MTIEKLQAIEIARNFAVGIPGALNILKPGCSSAELRDSNEFSNTLGVDSRHWAVTFEYVVPEEVAVMCPDQIVILVEETSGKATLATLM